MPTFDQTIRYAGLQFRVRTKQKTVSGREHIHATVLFRNRTIGAAQGVYTLASGTSYRLRLHRLIARHHRALVLDLMRGRLDDELIKIGAPLRASATPPARKRNPELQNISVTQIMNALLVDAPAHEETVPTVVDEVADVVDDTDSIDAGWVADHAMPELGEGEFDDQPPTDVRAIVPPALLRAATSDPVVDDADKKDSTFRGDLTVLSVPDLLQFLSTSRRTGVLELVAERALAMLDLRSGLVVGGRASTCANIGDLLVERGTIAAKQLHRAVAVQRAAARRKMLGDILLSEGALNASELEDALRCQTRAALLEVAQWPSGRFAFRPGDAPGANHPPAVDIALDTQTLLLDVLRVLDERGRGSRRPTWPP